MEKRKIYVALLANKGSCGGIGITCHHCPVRHICHDNSTTTSAPVRIHQHVKEWLVMYNANERKGIDEQPMFTYVKPPLGERPAWLNEPEEQHKCTCSMSDIMNFGCKCGGC